MNFSVFLCNKITFRASSRENILLAISTFNQHYAELSRKSEQEDKILIFIKSSSCVLDVVILTLRPHYSKVRK